MEQPKSDDRGTDTAVAILVAPIWPCFVFSSIWVLASAFSFGASADAMPSPAIILIGMMFTIGFLFFTYAALLIIGVPLFQILYFFGVRGRWPYVMFGFLAGGILPFILGNPLWVLHQHVSPLGAAIGATTVWIA